MEAMKRPHKKNTIMNKQLIIGGVVTLVAVTVALVLADKLKGMLGGSAPKMVAAAKPAGA